MAKEKKPFSFTEFINHQQETLDKGLSSRMGTADILPPTEYMPTEDWWKIVTKLPGFPINRMVCLAGDTDVGKTSATLNLMRSAQSDGYDIIYCESEGKTDVNRIKNAGIDTSKIMVISTNVAEVMFQCLFENIIAYKEANPGGKLFVAIDSLGNVTNMHDMEIDLTKGNLGVGSKGKVNRFALEILNTLTKDNAIKMCTLLINYVYDSMNAYGPSSKVIAGGKGIPQLASVIYLLSKKSDKEVTVDGIKYKKGIVSTFTLKKNHCQMEDTGAKKTDVEITGEGIKVVSEE